MSFKQENCSPKSNKTGRCHDRVNACTQNQRAGDLESEQTKGRWTAEFALLTTVLLPAAIPAES